MSNSPVCHIPPASTPADPQPKDLPGLPGPVTVNPNNLLGTLEQMAALLNAMRQLLQLLANQQGNKGITNNANSKQDKNQTGRWNEVSRVEDVVRVYQNNDPSSQNWVDVRQINQLTMGDSVSKARWVWNRNHG